jgi:hypothetical protein
MMWDDVGDVGGTIMADCKDDASHNVRKERNVG